MNFKNFKQEHSAFQSYFFTFCNKLQTTLPRIYVQILGMDQPLYCAQSYITAKWTKDKYNVGCMYFAPYDKNRFKFNSVELKLILS